MSEHITVRFKVDLTNFNRAMHKAMIAIRRLGRASKQNRRPHPNSALLERSRKRRR